MPQEARTTMAFNERDLYKNLVFEVIVHRPYPWRVRVFIAKVFLVIGIWMLGSKIEWSEE